MTTRRCSARLEPYLKLSRVLLQLKNQGMGLYPTGLENQARRKLLDPILAVETTAYSGSLAKILTDSRCWVMWPLCIVKNWAKAGSFASVLACWNSSAASLCARSCWRR